MLVTAIEPRRKSLAEVYLDGMSAGTVDYEALLRMHITVGQTITDAVWSALCRESDHTRARSYALWLLGRGSCTAFQLKEKLRRQYSADATEAAIARMQELGLINDADYARRYASDLIRLRGFSELRIVQELRRRGIANDLAQEIVHDMLENLAPDPQAAIRNLLETKFSGKFSDEKGKRRTVAALQRMGYRWDDIRTVLNESDVLELEP